MSLPIFVAQGTRDRNSAPESADAFVVELLRRDPKRSVRYLVLDGGDHGFSDPTGESHADEVLVEFVRWSTAKRDEVDRSVETRVLPSTTAAHHPTILFLRLPPWVLAGSLAVAALLAARLSRRGHLGWRVAAWVVALAAVAASGAVVALWAAVAKDAANTELFAALGALAAMLLVALPMASRTAVRGA